MADKKEEKSNDAPEGTAAAAGKSAAPQEDVFDEVVDKIFARSEEGAGVEPEPKDDAEEEADAAPKDDFYELFKAIALAAIIALCIRTLAYEPFNIPSKSMYPTLLVGDYLFVEKYAYGYSQYSLPLDILPFKGRVMEKPVTRGDVVVFRQPKQLHIDYIKRIVGLPGDRVQVKEGILHLNGEMVPRRFVGTENTSMNGSFSVYSKYVETLPNGVEHYIYELSDMDDLDDTIEYVVPEGHYFAMGDNRDSSQDSRVMEQVGFVPAENLIGRAVILFFSTEGTGDKCQKTGMLATLKIVACRLIEGPKAIRYSRIFSRVSTL